jgi:putative SOS response-associated peptidase YedK
MCGRFTLRTPLTILAEQFQFDLDAAMADIGPRFNIAPTQTVLAVRQLEQGSRRELARLFWGLIPSWAKDSKMAYGTINARADTVATKPTFRSAFKSRRCLVLADGYYEWQTEGKKKQPFLFEVDGGKPFAFAGLWEWWRDRSQPESPSLESCSLVTAANEVGGPVHDRMPVILDERDYDAWLDPANSDTAGLQKLLRSFPADRMTARPVSTYVSNSRNQGPDCVAPASDS